MNIRKILSALSVAGALGVAGMSAIAGPLSASDATFGSFDASSGTRSLSISGFASITDVNISIVFAKCDDPSLGAGGGIVGNPCIGGGNPFNNEVRFSLTHGATTVQLVGAGFSTQTIGGVVEMTFDDLGAAFPAFPTTGTFDPTGSLSDFNGAEANGLWTLNIQDTVGADRLDYFRSCLSINGDTGCGANNVPEPISLALFALGLAGLGYTRRKAA